MSAIELARQKHAAKAADAKKKGIQTDKKGKKPMSGSSGSGNSKDKEKASVAAQ